MLLLHLQDHPAIPLLDIYLRKMKAYVKRKTCATIFKAILFVVIPNWKQPNSPPGVGDKQDVVYPYIEILCSNEKGLTVDAHSTTYV